jgi:hypothetical protein
MFICLDCYKVFEEGKYHTETHGLERPPYEHWYGCPYCGGGYATAYKCNKCDEWIVGEYIKTRDGERWCEGCYTQMELGDED